MHICASNRGILEVDLAAVLANEDEKQALASVKSMDISKNELQTLSNLQPLTALIFLDCSFNRITALSGLPLSLTRLNVSNNCLTSLDGIAVLPFLSELDVSHNKIVMLSPLPRLSPLALLDASSNRITNVAGIEVLSKLQILRLDNNFVSSVEHLHGISQLRGLKTLSLRSCPIVQLDGYRGIIRSVAPHIVTLDGTVLDVDREPTAAATTVVPQHRFQKQHSAPHPHQRLYAVSDISASSVDEFAAQRSANASHDTSQHGLDIDSVRTKSEARKLDIMERLRAAEKEIGHLTLLNEQFQCEADGLRRHNAKLERELSENRRILGDELAELTAMRDVNRRLEEELALYRTKADKNAKDFRYVQQRLRAEQRRYAEEFEKVSVNHEAQVRQLQQKIHSNVEASRRMLQDDKRTHDRESDLQVRVKELEDANRELAMRLSTFENANSFKEGHLDGMRRPGIPAAPEGTRPQIVLPNRPIFDSAKIGATTPQPIPSGRTAESIHYEESPSAGDAEFEKAEREASTSASATKFAEQLKHWVLSEVSLAGQSPATSAEEPARPSRPPRKSARTPQ